MKAKPKTPAVETWPIEKVKPYELNPRKRTNRGIAVIADSIRAFGFKQPIVVDKKGVIIAGHGRHLAAQELGLAEVPVLVAKDLSSDQVKAYRIADNRTAEESGWDMNLLPLQLGDLGRGGLELSLTGFTMGELDQLLDNKNEGADEAPARPSKPISRPGDLWTLGDHRLLCGDATAKTDVNELLDGALPHLMVTDPPYGVGLDPAWRDRAGVNTLGKAGLGGDNYMQSGAADVEARWDEAWESSPATVFYVWCAGSRLVEVHSALTDANFVVRQLLVWDKQVLTRTRSHYWWSHEHCLYGVKKGATANWVGSAGQSTVWGIPSPKHIMGGSKEKNQPHPAQKPVECMRRPIVNNSKRGDAVYDPFVGSGTTIIAAEMEGRVCYAIDIDPGYVDVAVERWENFTGGKAKCKRAS